MTNSASLISRMRMEKVNVKDASTVLRVDGENTQQEEYQDEPFLWQEKRLSFQLVQDEAFQVDELGKEVQA